MDRRNPMDRHGPRRKRNPRASRPPLIPSRKLASARKSIPPSVSSLSIQVTGKQSQKQQLMESIDSESSKASEIPQKHVLQCILDTLQRRDTYDIFAEPVDPNEDVSYRESLLSFVNELGPKAKMVAARKLQSAALVDINGGGSGGAAAPGLLLRSFSLPTTTEPPPPPPPPPAPPQPQPTTSTATTRRSEMGGASSPGSFLRNYSLPLTTEPPPPPPPPHMPLPLRPQPTMTTTRRSEMGGAASPGLFLRNYSLPTTTTAEPPPPPPPPPQPQPTIAPTRRNEMREAAAGGVHCPNPTEENVRPVILALEHPHGNHALESGKAKSKRIGLHSTHNRSSDRGHSQAAVDSGQMQKKPKSSPPAATAAPSFPFDMCFLKAKLDRMIVEGSPVGRRGDSKFATGLQSWTGNRILADQRRFF